MRLSFRHGIVRCQTDYTGTPTFLRKSSLGGEFIDLIISPDPTIISIAHQGANYLIEETKTITHAWGPFAPHGITQYLYWDISFLDGSLTRSFTTLPPMITPNQPVNPAKDQHWFDLSEMTMKVWNGSKWIPKIRLFAATYDSNAIIIPFPVGSQINKHQEVNSGNIIFGTNNKPLRNNDGTFVTTESDLKISHTSSENVKFEAAQLFGEAVEPIPKFHLVSYVNFGKIALASSAQPNRQIHGIVQEDLYATEVGHVVANGIVRNDQWNFASTSAGKPLFCSANGEITLSPPAVGISQQVGFVYDKDAVFMNLMPAVRLSI